MNWWNYPHGMTILWCFQKLILNKSLFVGLELKLNLLKTCIHCFHKLLSQLYWPCLSMESYVDRSPEDVLRVTKEGLVKQRIQQFNRVPSLETLSQISEENCTMRRSTMGDVVLRQKSFANLSVPHRSSTVTRPHSSYITSTRISKIGMLR